MQKILLSCLAVICLCLVTGCSFDLVRTSDIRNHPGIRLIDPNEGPLLVNITKTTDETGKIHRKISPDWVDSVIQLKNPCRIKYQPFSFNFFDIIVVPAILPNGKTYNGWLDTGFSGCILINDTIIRENDLAIYPVGRTLESSLLYGFCHLPSVRIGQAVLLNPPCVYLQGHFELNVLGLPLYKDKPVLIGLRIMREFAYILFDNINKEVELSPKTPFVPEDARQWSKYAFSIEQNLHKRDVIIPDITIASQKLHIMFDTCGGPTGLALRTKMWDKIAGKVTAKKPKPSQFSAVYREWLPCTKTSITELKIGSSVVKDVDVVILPEETPYIAPDLGGLLSMAYFKKTIVVLDFERNLMWVKNPQAR